MKSDTPNDDHLPPPEGPAELPSRKSKNHLTVESGHGIRWGERAVFTAAGLLIGFTGAYLYLDRHPGPVPSRDEAMHGDPHAGVPGFEQGQMPAGQPAMPPPNLAMEQRIAALKEEVKKSPGNYDLLVQLGNAAFDVENWPLAVESYENAIKIRRTDPNVLTDLGVSYRNQGKLDKALVLFDESLKADPEHWQAIFNQVIIVGLDQGNTSKARELLGRLEALRAKHPEIPSLDRLKEALANPGKK
jgi:cytochrome c-type biogenesis protein CcmH/NrfG